jgi:hypothetical protein
MADMYKNVFGLKVSPFAEQAVYLLRFKQLAFVRSIVKRLSRTLHYLFRLFSKPDEIMATKIKVAIAGATGETGQSIMSALLAKPEQFVRPHDSATSRSSNM